MGSIARQASGQNTPIYTCIQTFADRNNLKKPGTQACDMPGLRYIAGMKMVHIKILMGNALVTKCILSAQLPKEIKAMLY